MKPIGCKTKDVGFVAMKWLYALGNTDEPDKQWCYAIQALAKKRYSFQLTFHKKSAVPLRHSTSL